MSFRRRFRGWISVRSAPILPQGSEAGVLWAAGAPQQGRTCGDREPASGRTSWRDGKNMPICIIFVRPKFIR